MSSKMREDWIECQLGEVCDIISGRNQKDVLNPNGKYPIYGSGGIFGYADNYLCDAGTTIIGRKGTINSPIYVKEKFWNVDTAFGIAPYTNIERKNIYYYCKGFNFKSLDKSTTIPSLAKRDILKIRFPLAPLPIQRAIVSKIEALFSDLDNGIANFKIAQEQLKIYRQAVLKKAFEGELTKEWREKQNNLPTAEELLKQIKEERQNHYNQQIEDWKKAVKEWEKNGKVDDKPRKPVQPKELPPLKKDELDELPILPNGWTWCRIADIGSVETGATPKRGNSKYWDNGSIPWITSGALNDDFVRECKEYVTEQALKETNIKVFPKHSLVMAMYGEGKTRGKSSELLIDTSTNQAIACIIQKNTESEIRKYLKSFLVKIYQDIRRKSSGGVQPNINLDIVKNLNLPLCSIQEQTQIVQEIESRLSVCDKMEQSINESIIKAEALRQSILKKAFEGRLLSEAEVEQCKKETDYEPASELLKKIKAEKLAKEQEKKKVKKK